MSEQEYKRPRFYRRKSGVRRFFVIVVCATIVTLAAVALTKFIQTKQRDAPIARKSPASSRVIDENTDADHHSEAEQSSASSSQSHKKSSAPAKANDDPQSLKGKTIAEAQQWATTHNRYCSWQIFANGNQAKVYDVQQNGNSIHLLAR